jgi:hypothetical protein
MTTTEEALIVAPDPERIVEGLRDTGYEFHTAVADLIDNSVAAGAEFVDVQVVMDLHGAIRVAIADDGCGMNREELINAMKYGSKRRADPSSLGKFGLGLKTASTAFCRRLSVTSRPGGSDRPLCATWDLDHIAKKGDWELLLSESDEETLSHLEHVAPGRSGTVVVWEKVDRLLSKSYDRPGGSPAQKALQKKVNELRDHLALVYQRFLDDNDERGRTFRLTVRGKQLKAWDPFAAGESELVAAETVPVEMPDGSSAQFAVRAFVLPRKEEFGDQERAAAARIGNDRQGIYIYRENRLIHDADWLGMYQKEPHFSLLRVEFSFDHRLDSAFHIDIKKSQILLDEELWVYLKDTFLPPARRAAEQRYRKGQRRQITEKSQNAHDASNRSIGEKAEALDSSRVTVVNPSTGEVEVTNSQGTTRLRLRIGSANKPGEVYVQPVDNLDDGMLWEPALIDGRKGVRINRGHPYYHKVYVPNLSSGVTVQGMDSLLWALCVAELGTVSQATKQHFGDLRFEVARLLRRLVDDLPEPEMSNGDA